MTRLRASSVWIGSSLGEPLPYPSVAAYAAEVLTVFTTVWGTKFHRSPVCHQVKKQSEIMEYDLNMIGTRTPCRTCFRDAPNTDVLHAYCPTCNSFRPCAHNGGVLVPLTRTRRSRSPYMDPGETYTRYDYVWPESVADFVS